MSDNPVTDVRAMILEILLLMPNVTDFQISLYKESDVDLIIQSLPNLQKLNNIAIEAEDLGRISQSPPSFEAMDAATI